MPCLLLDRPAGSEQHESPALSLSLPPSVAAPFPRRSAATGSAGEGEPPMAQPPREFSLIWRYNGKRPVTAWMPVAPPGYAALGAVVRGEPELPNTDDYLCIRCGPCGRVEKAVLCWRR